MALGRPLDPLTITDAERVELGAGVRQWEQDALVLADGASENDP